MIKIKGTDNFKKMQVDKYSHGCLLTFFFLIQNLHTTCKSTYNKQVSIGGFVSSLSILSSLIESILYLIINYRTTKHIGKYIYCNPEFTKNNL